MIHELPGFDSQWGLMQIHEVYNHKSVLAFLDNVLTLVFTKFKQVLYVRLNR